MANRSSEVFPHHSLAPKETLRVLCVISNPAASWGSEKSAGGGEIIAVEILKKLFSFGLHVETLEVRPSPSLVMGVDYPVNAVSLPLKMNNAFVAFFFLLPVLSLKFLKEFFHHSRSPDIVVAATSNLGDIIPTWLISRLLRKPFVVSFQVLNYRASPLANYRLFRKQLKFRRFQSLLQSLSSWASLRLSKSASAIFCLSKQVKSMLKDAGFPSTLLHVSGAGVDLKLIESIPTRPKCYDGGYLGRIEVTKGIIDLLESWAIVTKAKPHARLLVMGIGSFLEAAKSRAKELKIADNVEFAGIISGDKKYSCLKQCKVFVHPSLSEGWCLSVAEAMACELPVVCYDIPTFRELFGGSQSMFRVRLGDVNDLASRILHLLNKEKALDEYGKISKIWVTRYSWDSVATIQLNVLQELCRK